MIVSQRKGKSRKRDVNIRKRMIHRKESHKIKCSVRLFLYLFGYLYCVFKVLVLLIDRIRVLPAPQKVEEKAIIFHGDLGILFLTLCKRCYLITTYKPGICLSSGCCCYPFQIKKRRIEFPKGITGDTFDRVPPEFYSSLMSLELVLPPAPS